MISHESDIREIKRVVLQDGHEAISFLESGENLTIADWQYSSNAPHERLVGAIRFGEDGIRIKDHSLEHNADDFIRGLVRGRKAEKDEIEMWGRLIFKVLEK